MLVKGQPATPAPAIIDQALGVHRQSLVADGEGPQRAPLPHSELFPSGGLVRDVFSTSGNTSVAAPLCGRRYRGPAKAPVALILVANQRIEVSSNSADFLRKQE